MMTLGRHRIVLGIVCTTIIAACSRSPDGDTADASAGVSQTDRDRIQEFWTVYRAATQARIRGDIADAADGYRSALDLNPDHHDALYYLGNMELESGRFAEAEQLWLRLLSLDSSSARTHTQLGRVYACPDRDTLDFARARSEFERAAAINREETGALLHLAQTALAQGDTDTALRTFADVLTTNGRSIPANYFVGFIHWQAGRSAEARTAFETAIAAARPDTPIAGVPGEGDTKRGITPLLAERQYCHGFDEQHAGLDQAKPADMPVRYRATRAWLDTLRARPSSN